TGFKTKEFGGAGFSQLVFDDSDRQLRIQLHASTAHSQLNLGHLIHSSRALTVKPVPPLTTYLRV
ncbi:MAG: hypothetical protein EOO68_37505, partial [Moraxellaceae bacterium]